MIAEKIYNLLQSIPSRVIGDLPAEPSNILAIMEYSSDMNTEYFGTKESSTISNTVIKIVARNESYPDGEAQIALCKEILHRHYDDFFMSVIVVGSPIYLGKGTSGLHEFQIVFKAQIKE